MLRNDSENLLMSHMLGISLVLFFLLPHTHVALLLVNPLICIFFKLFRINRLWCKENLLVLIPICITLLLNLSDGVTLKSLQRFVAIFLCFSFFPLIGQTKLRNEYLCIILFCIIFSQLVYIFKIPILIELFNRYYPVSETFVNQFKHMQASITFYNMLDFRLGGLYRNSNQCARYLTMLLASFIVSNNNKTIKQLLPFLIANFVAVLITGSRTGFVIASLIIVLYLNVNVSIILNLKKVFMLIMIILLSYCIVKWSETLRSFSVIQGFHNSANAKFNVLVYYLKNENSIMRYLCGYLDMSRLRVFAEDVMSSFDCEYGYLIFNFGFVGFVSILCYYYLMYKKINNIGRIFFVNFLWMISSSLIMSYRSIFIFFILMSYVYNNCKRIENKFISNI